MKLKNELYSIKGYTDEENVVRFMLELNPKSFIYQAHFPNEPVTPGVCIVQMGREVLEELTCCTLELIKVKNVKFLSVIAPDRDKVIDCQLNKLSHDNGFIKAQLVFASQGMPKAKMSLVCKKL